MQPRLAVLIPGIMGSVLEQDGGSKRGAQTLWGEDLSANYRSLILNPGMLRWTGNPANARIMRFVELTVTLAGRPFSMRKLDMWSRVIDVLRFRPDIEKVYEFGYDWRAPLVESAQELAWQIQACTGAPPSSAPQPGAPLLLLVAHSMGGLLVRIAIAEGLIHPRRIDRIVHIGTPLRGTPVAFRTLYDGPNLPMFQEIFSLLKRKNRAQFNQHFVSCLRTFPSLYSLLPPPEDLFLYYSPNSRSNPLIESSISTDMKDMAMHTHRLLARSQEVIVREGLKAFSIYTEFHSRKKTDLEYRVTPLTRQQGYQFDELHASTSHGDGTVTSSSACGVAPVQFKTVTDVEHSLMCNNQSVADCLNTII